MRKTSLTAAVAASTVAAVLTLVASPLLAQGAKTPDRLSRVLATYDFGNRPQSAALPRMVTVTDSAGTIIARADVDGERRPIPMIVYAMDTDLVLQGETSEGVLTLVLDRQNEGDNMKFTSGRWMLGRAEGQLRGRGMR